MKSIGNGTLSALLALVVASCAGGGDGSDAYGNFEAVEVMVSSEAAGPLVRLDVREGDLLDAGVEVGLVDTLQLALSLDQLRAQRAAVQARLSGIRAELDVVSEEREVARKDLERVRGLLADGAATQKQLDDAEGRARVLDRQIEAVRARYAPVVAETEVLDAQLALTRDRLRRCRIVNPVDGTVLTTYAEAAEITAPGRPLYKVARLDTLELKAWVSGALLPELRLGQEVRVLVDAGGESVRQTTGTVSWIASEAEFTPKLIQTREERVNLVYGFKVRVANPDGRLKIGMPGEVAFGEPAP